MRLLFVTPFSSDKLRCSGRTFTGEHVASRKPKSFVRRRGALSTLCALESESGSQLQPESSITGPLCGENDAEKMQALHEQIAELGTKMNTDTIKDNAKHTDAFTIPGEDFEISPNQYLKVLTSDSMYKHVNKATEEVWSPDQRAMYSIISPNSAESESDGAWVDAAVDVDPDSVSTGLSFPPERFPTEEHDNEVFEQRNDDVDRAADVEVVSTYPGYSDPCGLDMNEVKRKLESLKSRRRELSYHPNGGARDAFNDSVLERKSTLSVANILKELEVERAQNMNSFSLKRARFVDLASTFCTPGGSALTSNAERLIAESMRVPNVYRPLVGMQEAFERVEHPPCPRCGSPTSAVDTDELSSLCGRCYSEIYLEGNNTFANEDVAGDIWSEEGRNEKKRLAAMAAENAANVAAQFLRKQVGASGLGPHSKASSAPTSPTSDNPQDSPVSAAASRSSVGAGLKTANGGTGNNTTEPPPSNVTQYDDGWKVRASARSMRTINPIRNLVQNISVKPSPDKDLIKLSIGDPTVYGNLKVSAEAIDKFCEVMRAGNANGYSMSMGSVEARQAVAKRYTSPESPLSEDDVILAAGTSGAIELAIGAMANEGDNVLLPSPGFPLFQTIAEGFGVECRYYKVDPDKNWEIDLGDVMGLADPRTAALVVNNPSNPCGSVYSEEHIEDILAAASALRVPIIADEVYADMVFPGTAFTAFGPKSLDVPVLSVGGISKQCVVPGWRLGWLLLHDRDSVLSRGNVRTGLRQLTTRMLVPNTPVQHVLPTLLCDGANSAAFTRLMGTLADNASFAVHALQEARGVRVVPAQGAMYAMVQLDCARLGVRDDVQFAELLLEEEAVFVLPGECFRAPGFVRIVFAAPQEILAEAFARIRAFCARRTGGM